MTSTSATRAAAAVASAAFLVLAGVHLTHGTFDDQLTSTVDYVNDASFTAALLGCAIAALGLARRAGLGPKMTLAVVGGPSLVAVGVGVGLALGHSPSWFMLAGGPGNIAWLVGLIGLSRTLRRSDARELPGWVVRTLPLTPIAGVLFGEFGGTLLPALLWAMVARADQAISWRRPTVAASGRTAAASVASQPSSSEA